MQGQSRGDLSEANDMTNALPSRGCTTSKPNRGSPQCKRNKSPIAASQTTVFDRLYLLAQRRKAQQQAEQQRRAAAAKCDDEKVRENDL
jgi:hypothetical protein